MIDCSVLIRSSFWSEPVDPEQVHTGLEPEDRSEEKPSEMHEDA